MARQFFFEFGNDGLETPAIVGLGGPGAFLCFFWGGMGKEIVQGLFFLGVEIDSTNGLNWCFGFFLGGGNGCNEWFGLGGFFGVVWGHLVGCP